MRWVTWRATLTTDGREVPESVTGFLPHLLRLAFPGGTDRRRIGVGCD